MRPTSAVALHSHCLALEEHALLVVWLRGSDPEEWGFRACVIKMCVEGAVAPNVEREREHFFLIMLASDRDITS